MPKQSKPDDPLEPSNTARSLSIALGVTEYLFLAGIVLLATGTALVFGFGWRLIVTGALLVFAAFFGAWIE